MPIAHRHQIDSRPLAEPTVTTEPAGSVTLHPDGLAVEVITPNGVERWPVEAIELSAVRAGVCLDAVIVRTGGGEVLSLLARPETRAGDVDDFTMVGLVVNE